MKLLIHSCCGPCLLGSFEAFAKIFPEKPAVFWYNPNIHPFIEYRLRTESFLVAAELKKAEIYSVGDKYGLDNFLDLVMSDKNQRCRICYEIRLRITAQAASKNGFSHFSTTLLLSPYQNHKLIESAGMLSEEEFKVKFVYKDLRHTFQESKQLANDENLYVQKYCGCIFSEHERYINHKKYNKKLF